VTFGYFPGQSPALPSVETLAQAPSASNVIEGSTIWIERRGAEYRATGGTWRPTGITDPRNLSATYYVSPGGSADGLGTSGDPLASLADVMTRKGIGAVGQIFVNVTGSLADTATHLTGPAVADGLHFIIISGATSVLLTTTIGAITQWTQNATTNTVGTIAGASSIAAYGGSAKLAGKRFRVTSGGYAGAIGVLGAVESGSNVLFVPPQLGLYTPGTIPIALNDTIEILDDPPQLCETLTTQGDLFLGLDNLTIGNTSDPHGVIAQNAKIYASACRFRCGVDVGAAAALELVACAADDTVRTYGADAGGGGAPELSIYGSHVQAVEVRGGKLLASDVHARGALTISPNASAQIAASSCYFLSATGSGTGVTMGLAASLDVPGVLNGRSFTASPAVLAVGNGAKIAYSLKPYFGSIGGTAKLYSFDASTSGVATDLPAAHANGASLYPRTYG